METAEELSMELERQEMLEWAREALMDLEPIERREALKWLFSTEEEIDGALDYLDSVPK